MHAANDSVAPVANAHKLYDALASKRKHLKILTAEESGCHHAQINNRQVRIDYIADWICDNLEHST